MTLTSACRNSPNAPGDRPVRHRRGSEVILSFDVEEHHRIEAAAGLAKPPAMRAYYEGRVEPPTAWLLDRLDELDIKATFFVVGELARSHPRLVRQIAGRGHEVGSHSWDHRRVHQHTPASFREDLRLSRDALQQAAGQPVLGYRAPTFSIVTQNAWAVDVLAEEGFLYDSSIFPVRHDRYGVPDAPRAPFLAGGLRGEVLEIPPLTMRLWRWNLPVAGGGYFRLFPLAVMRRALQMNAAGGEPDVAMLYFHPWEFDPAQARLPLGRWNAFRTYVGVSQSRSRLLHLIKGRRFVRALEVARRLDRDRKALPRFSLANRRVGVGEEVKAGGITLRG
jgi:polysaccharide deacetylase family protein (PEP-CTERM system associated)